MLFRKKVERYCAHCVFGGKIDDDTFIIHDDPIPVMVEAF